VWFLPLYQEKTVPQEAWDRTLLLYKGVGILSVGAASAAQKRQGGDGVCCAAEAAPTLMAFFEQRFPAAPQVRCDFDVSLGGLSGLGHILVK